jgi:predicted alpha/beta superfamily hydrolase
MRLRIALGIGLAASALGLANLCASAQPAATGEPIVLGQRFELRSQIMDEARTFQVHRPSDYDISNARYPVLIVLDGEWQFQHVSTTVDLLSDEGKIPRMLVIGIPNTDRDRDMDSAAAPGSSPFLKFITDELVATIDRNYRTLPYRILVGHSGAGLYALYTMINAPEAFRGYIVIAPAFGDNRDLPRAVETFLGEHEEPDLNIDLFMAADDSTGMQLSGAWELSSYVNERASRVRDLRFTLRRYAESHGTVPLLSVYDGLQSIFDGWGLHPDAAFSLYQQGGLAAIDRHFAALSTRLGFPVPVPDGALIGVFGNLESRKRFPEAEQLIKKVIERSPDDPAGHYYAARLYAQMGNRPLAIDALKESLRLSPNYGPSRGLLNFMWFDPNEFVPAAQMLDSDLAKFTGRYGTTSVVFEIELDGDELVAKTSEREYELIAQSATTFAYSGSSSGTLSFRTDDRGRVTGLAFANGPELAKLR